MSHLTIEVVDTAHVFDEIVSSFGSLPAETLPVSNAHSMLIVLHTSVGDGFQLSDQSFIFWQNLLGAATEPG